MHVHDGGARHPRPAPVGVGEAVRLAASAEDTRGLPGRADRRQFACSGPSPLTHARQRARENPASEGAEGAGGFRVPQSSVSSSSLLSSMCSIHSIHSISSSSSPHGRQALRSSCALRVIPCPTPPDPRAEPPALQGLRSRPSIHRYGRPPRELREARTGSTTASPAEFAKVGNPARAGFA